MIDLLELMTRRHSSRVAYDPARPVSRAALSRLLEAARWAPTAHNMQNFEVVVVDDGPTLDQLGKIETELSETFIRENFHQLSFSEDELKKKKVGLLGTLFPPSWRRADATPQELERERGQASLHDTIQASPAVLVMLYDPRRRAPASEGDFLGVVSLGCVMENVWLMAEWLGLSFQVMSVFANGRVERQVKELLGIPPALRVAFALRVGYPAEQHPAQLRVRREVEQLAHLNRYGQRGI